MGFNDKQVLHRSEHSEIVLITDENGNEYVRKTGHFNIETLAAIANETCADIFGLKILEANINDEKDNQTRFYVLSRVFIERNKKSKTAIILSPKVNKAGVLCEILQIFAKYDINLSYIDSRPTKRHLGEYQFFMELDGFENDEKIKIALDELSLHTEFLKILGSFSNFK